MSANEVVKYSTELFTQMGIPTLYVGLAKKATTVSGTSTRIQGPASVSILV